MSCFGLGRNSSLDVDRVVLRTIYEVFIRESSHFNSNQHRGIRVSSRMMERVDVVRASGDSEGSDDKKSRRQHDQSESNRSASTLPRSDHWIGRSPACKLLCVSPALQSLRSRLSRYGDHPFYYPLVRLLASYRYVFCSGCLLGLFLRSTNSELFCRRPSQLGGPRSL